MLQLARKRVCVTGGAGFLGSFVVDALRARGCKDVFVPRRRDFDLTTWSGIESMMNEAAPEVLFHLAAVVGGIGANQQNPGRFFYENAVMGIQLIEAARRHQVQKTIVGGNDLRLPEDHSGSIS